MTRELAPGSPKLEWHGKVDEDPLISDSEWEDLPDEPEPARPPESLKKIAKARRGATRSTG